MENENFFKGKCQFSMENVNFSMENVNFGGDFGDFGDLGVGFLL